MDGAVTAQSSGIAAVQCGYGNTAPLQLEFDPQLALDENGVDIITKLILGHFKEGGTLININVLDGEKLMAANKNPDFLYNPLSQGENRLPQRAYYIPYGEKKYAVNRQLGSNERYIFMNGEWNFAYFETPLDLPDTVEEIEFHDRIPVPSCWECYGYGQIQYTTSITRFL